MKLWFVVYIIHTVIFSQSVPGDDMGECGRRIAAAQWLLKNVVPAQPVNANIAPQYLKKETQERTMYCVWSEKDPAQK